MTSSLIKFHHQKSSRGKKLFWDRVHIDGLPYRGKHAPMMPEEEFEARTVRVADVRNGFFDVTDPEQNQMFLDVIDACYNGWYQCIHIERFWSQTTKHYLEWAEYFMEDGSRTPYAQPWMEMADAQQQLLAQTAGNGQAGG